MRIILDRVLESDFYIRIGGKFFVQNVSYVLAAPGDISICPLFYVGAHQGQFFPDTRSTPGNGFGLACFRRSDRIGLRPAPRA